MKWKTQFVQLILSDFQNPLAIDAASILLILQGDPISYNELVFVITFEASAQLIPPLSVPLASQWVNQTLTAALPLLVSSYNHFFIKVKTFHPFPQLKCNLSHTPSFNAIWAPPPAFWTLATSNNAVWTQPQAIMLSDPHPQL